MLHTLLTAYIEILGTGHGPDSQAARTFLNAHRQNTRFVRCALIAAFYWSTRH